MPKVIDEGEFRFVIYLNENKFEPPHVHIFIGKTSQCRLELNGENFMENPPPGEYRNVLKAYRKHADIIRKEWDRIHGR